jgi:hypothetical protein
MILKFLNKMRIKDNFLNIHFFYFDFSMLNSCILIKITCHSSHESSALERFFRLIWRKNISRVLYGFIENFLDMLIGINDIINRSPRVLRRRAQGCPPGWPLLFMEG